MGNLAKDVLQFLRGYRRTGSTTAAVMGVLRSGNDATLVCADAEHVRNITDNFQFLGRKRPVSLYDFVVSMRGRTSPVVFDHYAVQCLLEDAVCGLPEMVKEFQLKFGYKCRDKPSKDVSEEEIKFRMKLIAEEFCEILEAVYGKYARVEHTTDSIMAAVGAWRPLPAQDINYAELADGIADTMYVLEGTNLTFGFPSAAVLEEVHRANMAKKYVASAGDGGDPTHTKTHKVIKPPGWLPPDIAGVLRRAEESGSP